MRRDKYGYSYDSYYNDWYYAEQELRRLDELNRQKLAQSPPTPPRRRDLPCPVGQHRSFLSGYCLTCGWPEAVVTKPTEELRHVDPVGWLKLRVDETIASFNPNTLVKLF